MTASDPTRPDTVVLEPACASASFEPSRLEATRLEKLLGGGLCLLALAAGVSAGLLIRAASAQAESLDERHAEVAALSPAEKDHLRHQYARFTSLPLKKRDDLRDFDAELSAADDAEALRRTLRRFNDWLRTISLADRNELLKMADQPLRRVDRVEELSPLSRQDAAAVDKWVGELPAWGQWLLGAFGDRGGRRAFPPGKAPSAANPALNEADFDRLAGELSVLRQAELARQKSVTEKRRLVASWLQRRRGPAEPRFGPASNDELVHFFTDELPEDARNRLLALPLDQRNRELKEEYRKARSPEKVKRPPFSPRSEKEKSDDEKA